ncbi:MAG: dihydroorotase [Gammaproteobacteria bacterium]|nr:MAG: dihydroorotase [Gammaproteobacteria bacterium]
MTNSFLVANARIVNEGTISEGDVLIENGRISGINLPAPAGVETIDAAGAWLLPGMIDDQVHFREPGFEHKGTIRTESAAAVAGGITSYMEMPNCNPLTVTHDALADKHTRARKHSVANFAFYFGATNDNLESIKTVDPALACGVKVFMGASTGNMLVDNEATLEGIFASTPLIIATHCEDTPTILANEQKALEKYGEDIPFAEHPLIRSEEACYKSSSLAVELATRHGSRLHILHLTTAKEMVLFTPGDLAEKRITAEVCVHHLFFNDGWYPEKGAAIKCNPAIKTVADQEALIAAVNEDRIDVIATDHAPHTLEEKAGKYMQAPAGLPLAQHALVSLLELTRKNILTIEKVVEKTSHAPARLFGVQDRGFIREGYFADLVLIDPDQIADPLEIYSKCGWNPFAGIDLHARVVATWVNGYLRYRDGQLLDGPTGLALEFNRQ